MPMVDALFGGVASVIKTLPGRDISRADLMQTDVLLVRSVTPVNAALLEGTPVKFVGTATIGTDHLDIPWIEQQGIQWHNSPGCNADAVVDYVIAALSHWQQTTGTTWRDKTVGVVGCGNVGGRLVNRLRRAGVQVHCFDPPKAMRDNAATEYSSWDQVLQSDILCIHTPLTREGSHPTHHLLDSAAIQKLKPGALLINAGRGPVVCQQALKARLLERKDISVVLDVWETEPNPDAALMDLTLISTPHIAGYSLDGKIRGTWMLHAAAMAWLEQGTQQEPVSDVQLPQSYRWQPNCSQDDNIHEAVMQVFSIASDSTRMRAALLPLSDDGARRQMFDQLRKRYPIRREFSCMQMLDVPKQDRAWVSALGFQCSGAFSG